MKKYIWTLLFVGLLSVPAAFAEELEQVNVGKYQKMKPVENKLPTTEMQKKVYGTNGTVMLVQDPLSDYVDNLLVNETEETQNLLSNELKPIVVNLRKEVRQEDPNPDTILTDVVALKDCMNKLEAASPTAYNRMLKFLPNYRWGYSAKDGVNFSLVTFIDNFSVNAGEKEQQELKQFNEKMKKMDMRKMTKEEIVRAFVSKQKKNK